MVSKKQLSFLLVGILLLSALIRIGVVFATPDPTNYPDYQDFLFHAQGILHGAYPSRNVEGLYSFRAPLYPFILAIFLFLFGNQAPLFLVLFQALAGVGLVYAVYQLARRLFHEKAALLAAGLAAVYPYLLDPIRFVQTESLYALLFFTATLWFLKAALPEEAEKGRTSAYAAGAGLLYGLSILCRPSAMLIIPILAAWILLYWKRIGARAGRLFGITLAVTMMVVLPWTVRNYLRFSEWIIVNNQAGEILWLGNGPYYHRLYQATSQGEFKQIIAQMWAEGRANESDVRNLSPKQLERYYLQKTYRYVSEHPGESLQLLWRKWLDFWRPWVNPVAQGPRMVFLSALFAVPVFCGGFLGMIRLFRTGQVPQLGLFLAIFFVYSISFVIFHPTIRYRTPSVDIFLLALAGGGLSQGLLMGRNRHQP